MIVDFRYAPDRVYLQNICAQDSGRGPDGTLSSPERLDRPVPLLEFRVQGPRQSDDATLTAGQEVRKNTPIDPGEIVATRRFEFNRSNGAWQINGRFYDPNRVDVVERLGTHSVWRLFNTSGGWSL